MYFLLNCKSFVVMKCIIENDTQILTVEWKIAWRSNKNQHDSFKKIYLKCLPRPGYIPIITCTLQCETHVSYYNTCIVLKEHIIYTMQDHRVVKYCVLKWEGISFSLNFNIILATH